MGLGVRDDAGADLKVSPFPSQHHGANDNVEVHVSGPTQIPQRAGVRPAPNGFQFFDDFHAANLGRAGDRSSGEHGANEVQRRARRVKGSADFGNQVCHVGILFNRHELINVDRPIVADSSEIIASEVHQHDVFRPFFLINPEGINQGMIFKRRATARSRAGNGAHVHVVAGEPDQSFRRRGHQGKVLGDE